jgi:hypothetical protein
VHQRHSKRIAWEAFQGEAMPGSVGAMRRLGQVGQWLSKLEIRYDLPD